MSESVQTRARPKTVKLTKSYIDRAVYEGTAKLRDVRWDEKKGGCFGIRIYPSGKKTFVMTYRLPGHPQRLMVIGQYGRMTLDQAQKEFVRYQAEIGKGIDPLSEKRKLAQSEKMADLCTIYIEQHAKIRKKSWKKDQQMIDSHILPLWKNRSVRSITHSEVAALHGKIGRHSIYVANRTLSLLSKMFGLAASWGFVEKSSLNPAKGIEKFKETKRNRFVTSDEMPRLISAIDEEENFFGRTAIWLLLLIAARKSEILTAKWEDVDFQRRTICFRDTKNGKDHYLPLGPVALEVLRGLPRVSGNPHIIAGKNIGSHLVGIDRVWQRIRAKAGLEDVRIHDLRRTVGSWLAQDGNTLHLIGHVLNHSDADTTQVYAHFQQDHARAALTSYEKNIMATVKSEAADVLPITGVLEQ